MHIIVRKVIISVCFVFYFSGSFSQVRFLGLSQTFGSEINVIYKKENLGTLKVNDTLYLVDVSSIHLFQVKNLFTDSVSFFNFLGGDEYQENGKTLSYFNRRAKARYLRTIPYGDYLLSRELGDFFYKNNFFVCLKFSHELKQVKWIPEYVIKNAELNIKYDLTYKEIDAKTKKIPIRSSFKLNVVTDKQFNFAVVEETLNKTKYFSFFIGDKLIAQMFEGIE
jgi:hypothetical protein